MRVGILGELNLGQPVATPYVGVARLFTGGGVPIASRDVRISLKDAENRTLAVMKTDENGFIHYPSNVQAVMFYEPVPQTGFSFAPKTDYAKTIKATDYKPDDENIAVFHELSGEEPAVSWKTVGIIGAVAILGYLVYMGQKK